MRSRGLTEFVILASVRMTKEVFRQARRLGIIAKPYSWLIMNLVRLADWASLLNPTHGLS